MRRIIGLLAAAALVLIGGSAAAQGTCDFLTAGGYITSTASGSPANANFGIGGSCKPGGDQHGLWGHLEYIDHGTGLNVHWTTITAYGAVGPTDVDANGHPIGTRLICGTARTNQPPGDVHWAVTARDGGEPGRGKDTFRIQVLETGYDQSGSLQGGNIDLHRPTGSSGGSPNEFNCPAGVPSTSGCQGYLKPPDLTCTACPADAPFNSAAGTCVCTPPLIFDPTSGTCVPD